MRIIYHIDSTNVNIAPLVKAAMGFHHAKGIDDVKVAVTPIELYEQFKTPDYLELQKQARSPHFWSIPLTDVIEYPDSEVSTHILQQIKTFIEGIIADPNDQQHDTRAIGNAYKAFYKEAKQAGIPLPENPSMAYKPESHDRAVLNNNILIFRAYSQQISKGKDIDRQKKNLGEKEKIRIISDRLESSGEETEVHIIISRDVKVSKDLSWWTGSEAFGKGQVFVVKPDDFAHSLQQAMLLEQYGGADEKMSDVIKHIQWTLSGKLGQYTQSAETDPHKMDEKLSPFTKFLINPPPIKRDR